jgi:predicted RNase H-like HicB family nuclease
MKDKHDIHIKGNGMKTYVFRVVVEPDEDAWHAYCPALVSQGGATWGATKEEALQHIEEVVKMVVESLIEHGEPVPETPADEVQVSTEPQVAVTI